MFGEIVLTLWLVIGGVKSKTSDTGPRIPRLDKGFYGKRIVTIPEP
jgi:hypothetical protein